MTLTNALLAQWFKDWRALAMSINNAGGAVGTLFVVGTRNSWLLSSFGWRLSHIYLGAAIPCWQRPWPCASLDVVLHRKAVLRLLGCSTPCMVLSRPRAGLARCVVRCSGSSTAATSSVA